MNAAAAKNELIGAGSQDGDLTAEEMSKIVELALARIEEGAKVLAVVPDKTRDDNTDVLFPAAARSLEGKRVERFDALIAQGTHGRMSSAEKREKLGFGDGVSLEKLGSVYDHHWDDPNELTEIGEITATEVAEITGGIFNEAIPLKVNRLLAKGNYDHILIFGATVPHEVAGFAGGAKYFFPGVAGPELTHATHWLGALAGIENTIGRVETPTRRLIEAAADRVAADVICFTTAVTREEDDRLRTRGLFAGNYRESLRAGAAISTQVHITYTA